MLPFTMVPCLIPRERSDRRDFLGFVLDGLYALRRATLHGFLTWKWLSHCQHMWWAVVLSAILHFSMRFSKKFGCLLSFSSAENATVASRAGRFELICLQFPRVPSLAWTVSTTALGCA